MTDPDLYKVLGNGPETEIKIKGSRFLGQAFHAPDLETGRKRLETVRKKYHGATHHCWAARVGEPGRVEERSDDDGEPSGTAGAPILAALRGGELHDGLVVVTRYFGGVKLGTGPGRLGPGAGAFGTTSGDPGGGSRLGRPGRPGNGPGPVGRGPVPGGAGFRGETPIEPFRPEKPYGRVPGNPARSPGRKNSFSRIVNKNSPLSRDDFLCTGKGWCYLYRCLEFAGAENFVLVFVRALRPSDARHGNHPVASAA